MSDNWSVIISSLSNDSPNPVVFWVAFLLTVVLLVTALITGLRGCRRLHLCIGPSVMVALTVTIVLTEQLASRYEFPAEALGIHLWFAKSAALMALPVIATGIWLWRKPAARRWHRNCVLIWLLTVLLATGTGFWMFALATLKTA